MPLLKIGAAQISPVWLNKAKTLEKVAAFMEKAARENCDIVAFGEALVPGYPAWLEATNGCRFDDRVQKEIFAHYARNSVRIKDGDLDDVSALARRLQLVVVLGVIEAGEDRGGHTLYCSSVFIDGNVPAGVDPVRSVHRKLMPTYDERLVWGQGDGHGLVAHEVKGFRVTRLNCWENWMPLARASLYAQGSDVHFAHWPGSVGLTQDITRFVAKENRSFVVSVGNCLSTKDFCPDIPHLDEIRGNCPEMYSNGGSCVAGPDGKWVIEPQTSVDELITAELDLDRVREERQNFDPAGHYSRPDVTRLVVNRERQSTVRFEG